MLELAILSCTLAAGTCHPVADPSARSYAVRVNAPAGTAVRLTALDVPRGWTASFCTPRICSPFHVTLPAGRTPGTIQISYVPGGRGAAPLHAIHVGASAAHERAAAHRTVTI